MWCQCLQQGSRSGLCLLLFYFSMKRRLSHRKSVTENGVGLRITSLLFGRVDCPHSPVPHMWHRPPQQPLLWELFALLNPFTLSVPSSRVGETGNDEYMWAAPENNVRCIVLHWELENQYTLVWWHLDFSERPGALLQSFICCAIADHFYKINSPKEQQF